jgi:hypothetical protein
MNRRVSGIAIKLVASDDDTIMQAVGANYPADYSTMLRNLIAACKKDAGRRVDASSSHSIHRRVDLRVAHGTKHRVDVKAGRMDLVISDMGVWCTSHQLGDIVVKGCSLEHGGAWFSVQAALEAFWLEIHVPLHASL